MARQTLLSVAALVLLLLSPLFGGSGQVQAGFVDSPSDTRSDTSWKAVVSDFLAGTDDSEKATSSGPSVEEEPAKAPEPTPTKHTDHATTGGAGSTSSSGIVVGGAVAVAFLDPHVEITSIAQAGRLFLAEQRDREHPLASRLFRPPRSMHCHTL